MATVEALPADTPPFPEDISMEPVDTLTLYRRAILVDILLQVTPEDILEHIMAGILDTLKTTGILMQHQPTPTVGTMQATVITLPITTVRRQTSNSIMQHVSIYCSQ